MSSVQQSLSELIGTLNKLINDSEISGEKLVPMHESVGSLVGSVQQLSSSLLNELAPLKQALFEATSLASSDDWDPSALAQSLQRSQEALGAVETRIQEASQISAPQPVQESQKASRSTRKRASSK